MVLFFTRLALYLLAFSLPLFHPGIVISYDVMGWWLFFALVPGEMLIAYFLAPPRLRLRTWLISAGALILLSIVILPGFSPIALAYLGAGALAFFITALIFHSGGRGRTVAMVEVFLLGVVYYRMLSFSRASEEVARQAGGIAQGILFLSIGAFLVHCVVLYLAAQRGSAEKSGESGGRRELVYLFALIVPLGLLIAFLMPPDFVSHSIVFNRLKDEPDPELIPLDEYAEGLPGGNLRSDRWPGERDGRNGQGENGENGEQGEGNSLEGYPSDRWGDSEMGRGENKQYAVMVVASEEGPVYAADAYYGQFDPERGFTYSREQELNELAYLRLLETWRNPDPADGGRRDPREISYLSTISERVLAYQPRSVEPTILNRKYHPFSYSYNSVSDVSTGTFMDWAELEGLSEEERVRLSGYMELPLSEEDRSRFAGYLEAVVGAEASYYEKLIGILRSFETYQYQVGFTDDVSVESMRRFLFESRQGDCTEFSNTTAILARMAGIPARVVTGYLASAELQTPAHRRGVMVLWQELEPLQRFNPADLYLVTTAHRHSWVQIYMPDHGWVDFETTSFAIPPAGTGDPNAMDVVIPIIQEQQNPAPTFEFPWALFARSLLALVVASTLGAYLLRYGREGYLTLVARSGGSRGLRALQGALLMRLAAEGSPLKARSQTIQEYSEENPSVSGFASLYTVLRYKERFRAGERERMWRGLTDAYRSALESSRRSGPLGRLKRFLSLRGLYYL